MNQYQDATCPLSPQAAAPLPGCPGTCQTLNQQVLNARADDVAYGNGEILGGRLRHTTPPPSPHPGSPHQPFLGTPKFGAASPDDALAANPHMMRRLITLSTAGNLKISPLAPQSLQQQRRPMAALRVGDMCPVPDLVGAATPPPVAVSCSSNVQQPRRVAHSSGGSIGLGTKAKASCDGKEDEGARPSPSKGQRPLTDSANTADALGPTNSHEVLTPSRLVLRPIRQLQAGADGPGAASQDGAVSAGGAATVAWPPLEASPGRPLGGAQTVAISNPVRSNEAPGASITAANGFGRPPPPLPPNSLAGNGVLRGMAAVQMPARLDLESPEQTQWGPDQLHAKPELAAAAASSVVRCSRSSRVCAAVAAEAEGAPRSSPRGEAPEASVCMGTFDPHATAGAGKSDLPLMIEVTVAVRLAKGRGKPQGGGEGGLTDAPRNGYVKGPTCGKFYLQRYIDGRDCILTNGRWLSRSQFEKMGGSAMAKWYRSIRVLPNLEPLGEWLERHNLPVHRGPSRRTKKRNGLTGADQLAAGDAQCDSEDEERWEPNPVPRFQREDLRDKTPEHGKESRGPGRATGEAMMTALLATAAAAAAAAGADSAAAAPGQPPLQQRQQSPRDPPHQQAAWADGLLHTRTSDVGDEGLVRRLLASWPLSPPLFTNAPHTTPASGRTSGKDVQEPSDQGGGGGLRATKTPALPSFAAMGAESPTPPLQWTPSAAVTRAPNWHNTPPRPDGELNMPLLSSLVPQQTPVCPDTGHGMSGRMELQGFRQETGCSAPVASPVACPDGRKGGAGLITDRPVRARRQMPGLSSDEFPNGFQSQQHFKIAEGYERACDRMETPVQQQMPPQQQQQPQHSGGQDGGTGPRPRLLLRTSVGTPGNLQGPKPILLCVQAPPGMLYCAAGSKVWGGTRSAFTSEGRQDEGVASEGGLQQDGVWVRQR